MAIKGSAASPGFWPPGSPAHAGGAAVLSVPPNRAGPARTIAVNSTMGAAKVCRRRRVNLGPYGLVEVSKLDNLRVAVNRPVCAPDRLGITAALPPWCALCTGVQAYLHLLSHQRRVRQAATVAASGPGSTPARIRGTAEVGVLQYSSLDFLGPPTTDGLSSESGIGLRRVDLESVPGQASILRVPTLSSPAT